MVVATINFFSSYMDPSTEYVDESYILNPLIGNLWLCHSSYSQFTLDTNILLKFNLNFSIHTAGVCHCSIFHPCSYKKPIPESAFFASSAGLIFVPAFMLVFEILSNPDISITFKETEIEWMMKNETISLEDDLLPLLPSIEYKIIILFMHIFSAGMYYNYK